MRIQLTFETKENQNTRLGEHHGQNWKSENPTDMEIAFALVDECRSWLGDLGCRFTIQGVHELSKGVSESSLEEHMK